MTSARYLFAEKSERGSLCIACASPHQSGRGKNDNRMSGSRHKKTAMSLGVAAHPRPLNLRLQKTERRNICMSPGADLLPSFSRSAWWRPPRDQIEGLRFSPEPPEFHMTTRCLARHNGSSTSTCIGNHANIWVLGQLQSTFVGGSSELINLALGSYVSPNSTSDSDAWRQCRRRIKTVVR